MADKLTLLTELSEPTDPEATYYNQNRASKLLGLYPQKIFYAISKGEIIPYQTSPIILISLAEIYRYANKNDITIVNEIPEE